MSNYTLADLKSIFEDANREIKEINGLSLNQLNRNERIISLDISEMRKQKRIQVWNKYFGKLNEMFPGCLSSKKFVIGLLELDRKECLINDNLYDVLLDNFSGKAIEGILEQLQIGRWKGIAPQVVEQIEADILSDINKGKKYKMYLFDDIIGDMLENPQVAFHILRQVETPEWCEEVYYSQEEIIAPLADFSKAKIIKAGEDNNPEVSAEFERILEIINALPYKSYVGCLIFLYKQGKLDVNLLPQSIQEYLKGKTQVHTIGEVEMVVREVPFPKIESTIESFVNPKHPNLTLITFEEPYK